MKQFKLFIAVLFAAILAAGCTEESSTTTTVDYGTNKGISHTTWKCITGSNTLTFIFTSETQFQFTDEYQYNGKPMALVAHGSYTYNNTTLKLTFTDSTGDMPNNQTCTVSGNRFTYGGHVFVKQ